MSNQTPNAIAASATLYIDRALPIGERISLRSSNGIAQKMLEAELSPGGNFFAVFALDQPLTNDEAVITAQTITPGGPAITYWITPTAQQLGIPALDLLLPNLLVALCENFFGNQKNRSSVSVERLITTATPIPGEPLP